MRILLVGLGSAGDVHPNVGLGMALRRRGHQVTLVAASLFRDLAAQAGLDFFGLGSDEEHQAVLANPDLWHPRRAFPLVAEHLISKSVRPVYAFIERSYEPGRTVVAAPATAFGARIAQEKLGVPLATVHLQPSVIRSCLHPPTYVIPDIAAPMPVWMRRLYFSAVDRFIIDPCLEAETNGFRRELGLDPVRRFFDVWMHSPQMVIGLFPDWFAPPSADWPPQVHLTGFPLWDERDVRPPNVELARFLAAGDPPIVFTAGSANVQGEAFFQTAVETCRLGKRRGILATRFPQQIPSHLPEGVRHFDYIPFSQLLPHAAALVHHGGVGTMAQALAAGIPQLIMPLAHDQFDNAMRVRRLNCGDFLLPKYFSPRRVLQKLTGLLNDGAMLASARERAGVMRNVDSLEETCNLIEVVAK